MDITVYTSALNAVGIIDAFDSLLWHDKYTDIGSVELVVKMSDTNLSLLQTDRFLAIPYSNIYMVIETIELKSDIENGDKLIVRGRPTVSILDRRIIWSQTNLTGSFQTAIQTLLNESIISPTDTDRRISNFQFLTSTNSAIVAASLVREQFYGENLLEVIKELCYARDFGFRVYIDPIGPKIMPNGDMELWSDASTLLNWIKNPVGTTTREPTIKYAGTYSLKQYNAGAYSATYQSFTALIPGRAYILSGWMKASGGPVNINIVNASWGLVQSIGVADGETAFKTLTFIANGTETIIYTYTNTGVTGYFDSVSLEPIGNYFTFSLYNGVDRSFNQLTNSQVVFSPEFDNLLESDYIESVAAAKTVTLVAGEGDGSNMKTISVAAPGGALTGLSRKEAFTDATATSSTTAGGTLTTQQYNDLLTEKGQIALADLGRISSFGADVDATVSFIYGDDFFLGDIVQAQNEYGLEGPMRVSEVTISEDVSGFKMFPTFEMI